MVAAAKFHEQSHAVTWVAMPSHLQSRGMWQGAVLAVATKKHRVVCCSVSAMVDLLLYPKYANSMSNSALFQAIPIKGVRQSGLDFGPIAALLSAVRQSLEKADCRNLAKTQFWVKKNVVGTYPQTTARSTTPDQC